MASFGALHGVFVSSDGVTWSLHDVSEAGLHARAALAYGNARFVVVGFGGGGLYGRDDLDAECGGAIHRECRMPGHRRLAAGRFVAGTEGTDGCVATSTDGLTWATSWPRYRRGRQRAFVRGVR
ncbi:MAG: hypothetical protein MZV65_31545 [Chromatiales bacterium]|nr:hypothetical protein [Chromatiales bacterium]